MQPEDPGVSATTELTEFLDKTLIARGHDAVTAAVDLCAHASIKSTLRDAACNLVGQELYKKKPPGDTTLYTNNAWSLESLALVKPSGARCPAVDPTQLAAAFSLPPGHHTLPEEAKGPRVVPPSQRP